MMLWTRASSASSSSCGGAEPGSVAAESWSAIGGRWDGAQGGGSRCGKVGWG
uniref:Uncharacterized protein n=1 Tax=Arundo donax TaxID=35708 RepID=A0A0A8Y8Q0_ARUDO